MRCHIMFTDMEKNKDIKIIASITIATIVGKLLGVIKDSLISYFYGTSSATDAFFLALSIPTILLGIFTASTDSAIIPQYTRVMQISGKQKADRLFFSILNTLAVICIFACICIFIFPQLFIKVFAPGFDSAGIVNASGYLRVFSAIGFFHMLYCFLCTYNAAYKRNVIRAILAFSTNLIIVVSTIMIGGSDLYYLAFAYLIANVVNGLLPIAEMKRIGFKYSMVIDYNNPEYKRFWTLFLPIMGGALLNDIQQYVDKNLCSGFEGGISYLNYGSKLVNIFDSVLVVGIGVVLLPLLSGIRVKKDNVEFSKVISKVTRYLLEILIPFFVMLYALATPLIMLFFGRGQFDQTSVLEVSKVLRAYSGLIVLMPVITIFSKFYHSKEKNSTPFVLSAVAVGINTMLSVILKHYIGVQGVALATTIASVIEIFVFVILIEKDIKWDKCEINFITIFKLIIPVIASIFATKMCATLNANYFVNIIVSGTMIFLIFGISYFIMFKDDMFYMLGKVKPVIRKGKK